jgi:hypothetical protein
VILEQAQQGRGLHGCRELHQVVDRGHAQQLGLAHAEELGGQHPYSRQVRGRIRRGDVDQQNVEFGALVLVQALSQGKRLRQVVAREDRQVRDARCLDHFAILGHEFR